MTPAELASWVLSPGGQAAARAACEFAQRTMLNLTSSEVCAIVVAAHEAEVAARGQDKPGDQEDTTMTSGTHPQNGVTLGFPQKGEVLITTYGEFSGSDLIRLIADAFRVVERDTGRRPVAGLSLRDGSLEIGVTTASPLDQEERS